ncbi:hypothetical protein OIU74_002719 [Salix koriyanagi]|uniref:Uncharacterized protein n=1 Tax=Salix koriyanagi TaxID=2511006 RepID=A0A9Q0X472_9ROSI|nr:hypothetical protein OIU74_002719 [Salix koriyanagi]
MTACQLASIGPVPQSSGVQAGPAAVVAQAQQPVSEYTLRKIYSAEGARKALEEPHKSFEGHMLHCQKAIDGPKPGKSQKQPQQYHNLQSTHYQRNDGGGYVGGGSRGGHLMAPAAAGCRDWGAGLGGLTNLLGTLGSAAAVTQGGLSSAGHAMQGAYGNQASISPGVMGTYANQGAMQGGYPNQQTGQGGSGRGQHGQYAPYMGH